MNPARIEATVLMCDMRGFTAMVDALDAVDAMHFATSVMTTLGEVVEECGGTIDKFMGDGLLAHFGVADPDENSCLKACNTALRLKETESRINALRYSDSLPVISFGIGLCTGPVAAGLIQTKHRSEMSIFGDTVNMAARIENLTRLFEVDILLCPKTAQLVSRQFKVMAMPAAKLRGKPGEFQAFWLIPSNRLLGIESERDS